MSTSSGTRAAQTQSIQQQSTRNFTPTSIPEQSTGGEVVTKAAKSLEGNYPVLGQHKNGNPIMSGGFRKTNKRRNNKGRKRSEGNSQKINYLL